MKTKIKILVFLSVAVFGTFAFKSTDAKKIIVIDAGHGGDDSGASLEGLQEKIIVETIAKKIKDQNKDGNLEIILLREGDKSMDLKERTLIINKLKPALTISLHINSNSNLDANGVGAYIPSDKRFYDQSKEIAEIVIDKLAATGNLKKRKVSEAPFYLLKNAECPIMTLEVGYLSNQKDRNYISSDKGQDEIAAKILEAVK